MFLFGSVARGEQTETSDVDLFVEQAEPMKFGLLALIGVQHYVEDMLAGSKVDLTTRDSLHPMLKERIEASAVRIF